MLSEIKKWIKQHDRWAIFFALLMSAKVWGFIPPIPEFAIYGVLFLYFIRYGKDIRHYDLPLLLLILYIPLNLLMTSPPALFRPWMRYGLFLLMLVCISSLVQTEKARYFRRQLFEASMWLCAILGAGSFVCFFLGINFMQLYSTGTMHIEAGLFSGLINHSMMMGPIAGCGAVFMGNKAYESKNKVFIYLCIACVGAVMLSASRSAFMATFAGILFMLRKATNGSGRFVRILTSVVLVGALTFPLWQGVTDFVVEKQSRNLQSGGSFSSRETKWENRVDEFNSSPLFGIGYVSVGLNTDDVDPSVGTVEPGSSWLAILSMTGLLGFIIMSIVFYSAIKSIINKSDVLTPSIIGVIVLMACHMGAEGYIFSANSYLFFLIWLALGCATDYRYSINR